METQNGNEKILCPGHLYEVGKDTPAGYYIFCSTPQNALEQSDLDAEINMYKAHPPVSQFQRERGYWGCTLVSPDHKYIDIKNGQAIYYGENAFNLYTTLNSVVLENGVFYPQGIVVLSSEICTLKVYMRDNNSYLYHGDTDVFVLEQYLYSIGEHNFWAGYLNVKSYKSYRSIQFGVKDLSKNNTFIFGDKGIKISKITDIVYSQKDFPLRLYRDGLYIYGVEEDFFSIELPMSISMDSTFIEWIQPSCGTEKLFYSEDDVNVIYAQTYTTITDLLHKYREIGIEIDVESEIKKLEQTPDFSVHCYTFLNNCFKVKELYDKKESDTNSYFTFQVQATYDKKFYCAAKLADFAQDVQKSDDGTFYLVTFHGGQIEEIRLMCANLMDELKEDPEDITVALEYLYDYDFFTYLTISINQFIGDLQRKYGYSKFVTNSVLLSIKKAIKRTWSKELNKLYSIMAKERRISTRWGSEYTLYFLISQYFDDAIYQYRAEWLGLQSYDIFIPSLNVAIEYQGIQHYNPVDVFGGKEALIQTQERDIRKRKLSADHHVKVLDWKYNVPLNTENIQQFFKENGISISVYKPESGNTVVDQRNEMAPPKPKNEKVQKRQSTYIIRQFGLDGSFVAEYDSVAQAAAKVGISVTSINKVIHNQRKTSSGYIWKRYLRSKDADISSTSE